MHNVLLVNTPLTWDKFQEKEKYLPPLGLGYIASCLQKNKIEVELTDSLEEYLSADDVIHIIQTKTPEFVGLNVFTPNLEIVKEIILHIPEHIKIILGGQVMKSVYQELIDWNKKHKLFMVLGEGELIIPDIVQNKVREQPIFASALCKVYHVTKNSIYFPADLSVVKLERSLFKKRNMKNHFGLEEACMISSRGCIYQCAFCGASNSKNPDTIWRVRENSDLLEEINEIKRFTPGVSCIRMLDDLFLRNRSSVLNAMELFDQCNLQWRAMAHVLSFSKSMDLIPEMKKSGCLELFIGIESGSEKIREMIHKQGELEYIFLLISNLLRNGISVKGYFMYGFPDETEEDMKCTYEFAKSLYKLSCETRGGFRNSTFQFRPYHGTELYNKIKLQGRTMSNFKQDDKLISLKGRQQFNIVANNYSECSQEMIDEYIAKTLRLNGDLECLKK